MGLRSTTFCGETWEKSREYFDVEMKPRDPDERFERGGWEFTRTFACTPSVSQTGEVFCREKVGTRLRVNAGSILS